MFIGIAVFISGTTIASDKPLIDKITVPFSWLVLIIEIAFKLFPKWKCRVKIWTCYILNSPTRLRYVARLDLDEFHEYDIAKVREKIEKTNRYNDNKKNRMIIEGNKLNASIDDTSFILKLTYNYIYIEFNEMKLGYRENLKEISKITSLIQHIIDHIENIEKRLYTCTIIFEKSNPFVELALNVNDKNSLVINIKSQEFEINNNSLQYSSSNAVEFHENIKRRLLL